MSSIATYLLLRLPPSVTALTWSVRNYWLFAIAGLAMVFFIHMPKDLLQDVPAKQVQQSPARRR